MEIERSQSFDHIENNFEGRIPKKNEELKSKDNFSSSNCFKGSQFNM